MTTIDLIKSDLARWDTPSLKSFLKWMIMPRGSTVPYCFWLRMLAWARRRTITKYTIGLFCYFIYRHLGFKYGITVDSSMQIGKGLKIVHGGCVFLNCRSIGDDFTVYQGVTLGSDTKPENIPVVMNNVTVYTGSVVVGDIRIGNNSIVGCNSYVHNNVEDNSIIVGSPARIIGYTKG